MDPRIRIRIHTKMSWIRNTGKKQKARHEKFSNSSKLKNKALRDKKKVR
jgi:hypothetical protein